MTDILSVYDAARECGEALATNPCCLSKLEAAKILGECDAGGWEVILALLPGLCDPCHEVYQEVILAFSRMR